MRWHISLSTIAEEEDSSKSDEAVGQFTSVSPIRGANSALMYCDLNLELGRKINSDSMFNLSKSPLQPSLKVSPFCSAASVSSDLEHTGNEVESNFQKRIKNTCENIFARENKKENKINKYMEINRDNLSQNANTTPEPGIDDGGETTDLQMASQVGTDFGENTVPPDYQNEAKNEELSFETTPRSSLEEKFGHLSIFAPQVGKEKHDNSDMESVSRALVSTMLEKCIESIQKPTVNSRLSGRNTPNTGTPVLKTRIECSSQEMAHLESELEKKISSEKRNIERENDCQFSHGDGEALQQSADDIEILRRQRMERLQQLRSMLEQKKTERKEFEKGLGMKYAMKDEKEIVKMEQIEEEREIEEDKEGVAIAKAPTHVDVLTAPTRRGIRSIYNEVQRTHSSSSSDSSDITCTDTETCDENDLVVLSDLELRTYTEENTETGASPSYSENPHGTVNGGNSRQDSPSASVFNKAASTGSAKPEKTRKAMKDPYAKYEHVSRNQHVGGLGAPFVANAKVPDTRFWKDLNENKVVLANKFVMNAGENSGNFQEISKWVTRDMCPAEESEITSFFENSSSCSFPAKISQKLKSAKDIVYPDDLLQKTKQTKKKFTGTDAKGKGKEKSKREKSKKKSRETTKLKATSTQAESESATMQTHAYFRNRLHTEDPKEAEEEKRREIRNAENLVFFRTIARESEYWKPSILEPLPGSNGSSTSQKQTRFTSYRPANSGFAKSSDIDMLLGGSQRKESAIPNDPANYVSENQAEENMLFFKYVARNRSFFQFKES